MFFGAYKLYDKTVTGFYDYDTWHSETFCPDTEIITRIDLKVHGKTYQERKENVREKAIEYQNIYSVYGLSISYQEVAIFGDYFTEQGKRYGLMNEFKENWIC